MWTIPLFQGFSILPKDSLRCYNVVPLGLKHSNHPCCVPVTAIFALSFECLQVFQALTFPSKNNYYETDALPTVSRGLLKIMIISLISKNFNKIIGFQKASRTLILKTICGTLRKFVSFTDQTLEEGVEVSSESWAEKRQRQHTQFESDLDCEWPPKNNQRHSQLKVCSLVPLSPAHPRKLGNGSGDPFFL